ncbi:MAG: PAS domain S-box protein [Gallionellaceae bacterium]
MRHVSITYKVVLALLLVSLIPLFAMQWMSAREFEQTLTRQILQNLGNVASKKAEQLGIYVTERISDLEFLASNPQLSRDLVRVSASFKRGIQSAQYLKANAEIRPYYERFATLGDYYDLFFVDTEGNIVFSIIHEDDFASNLNDGPYRNSELARVVGFARDKLTSGFSDVEYHAASNKAAAFIATPVISEGKLIGVLAMQINQTRFEAVAKNNTGLGASAETVIAKAVGENALFLFSLKHDPDAAMKRVVKKGDASGEPILNALQGKNGEGLLADYYGRKVIAAWRYIPEARLGMVVKVYQDAALAPVAAMRQRLLIFEILVTFLVIGLGLFFAKRLIRPVRELSVAAQAIAQGGISEKIELHGKDELTQLGESFNQMAAFVRGSSKMLEERVKQRTLELEIANISLAENERFIRTIMDTVASGIITINEKGIVQSVNRATEQIFGYESHEMVGENIKLLMPEPYHSEDDGYIEKYLVTGERKAIGMGRELSGLSKNGVEFPIELAVSEMQREGEVRFFVGIITDITERKAVQSTNLRHTRAIEESPVMVVIADRERNIEYVNPAFTNITGYSLEEVLGLNMRFIKSRHMSESIYQEILERLQSGHSWCGELEDRRKDGSLFWVSANLSPVRNEHDEIVNYVSVEDDITERKKMETEIRQHRDHLADLVQAQTANIKAIVDTAADGIVTIDQRGNVLSFNGAAERMFGFSAEEIVGANINMLMPQPYHAAHDGYLERYVKTREAHIIGYGREVVGQRKDGSTFPLYLAVSEMKIGAETRFTGIVRDISMQKDTEAALVRARKSAETASQAKSNFLANMSHEIRTPMNAIIGMTDLVLDSTLQPQQEKLLRSVASSAKSLLTILNDILDLSKLESGKMELEAIPFSIREVLEGVEDVVKVGAAIKGLSVSVYLDGSVPPCVTGDPTRLRQVLLNLAGNAVKFTQKGEVSILARPSEQSGEWHFSVKDTGIGIPQDGQGKIFERFSQADETTTRHFGGTGLGTSISREIVECMGGRIWVASEEGQGSDFQFTAHLPTAVGVTECATRLGGSYLGRSPYTRPLRILLAEDILLNQELAEMRLTQRQHQVEVAVNGRIAVERFQQEEFDLILMDVMMPEMDGEVATRTIRAIEKDKGGHIPIIMLTASVMHADQRKYFEAGADAFVGKPIDFAVLYEKIANYFPVIDGPVEVVAQQPVAQLPLIAGVDLQAGMLIWGEWASYRKALLNFRRNYAASITDLQRLFEAERFDEAALLAHTIKGVAGNLAAKDLAAAASELERSANESVADVATALVQAGKQMELLVAAIGEVEQSAKGTAVTLVTTDPVRAQPLLQQLIASLERAELDDVLISQLREALDTQRFGRLEMLIDAFEFDSASALANEFLSQFNKAGEPNE